MTISDLQRQRTEDRIRAAIDRLLHGQIPPGGGCNVKTLAREAGVSRASLYRTYQHLKHEFEQRLARMRDAGEIPDPRAAQIVRLTDENARLRQGLAGRDQRIAELTALKTTAISRLTAQYTEITGLRAALADASNVRILNHPRLTSPARPASPDRTAP
jgi:AraC-like DNA-binding protein